MGIGKPNLPNNADKSVRGDDRVGDLDSVNASLINGKGAEAACGIAADYRCGFKIIVRVVLFKL